MASSTSVRPSVSRGWSTRTPSRGYAASTDIGRGCGRSDSFAAWGKSCCGKSPVRLGYGAKGSARIRGVAALEEVAPPRSARLPDLALRCVSHQRQTRCADNTLKVDQHVSRQWSDRAIDVDQ